MKYAELARKLRSLGYYFTWHGAGSHEIWRNPVSGKQTSIPYHGAKDMGPKLLSQILWQQEIDRQDFDQA